MMKARETQEGASASAVEAEEEYQPASSLGGLPLTGEDESPDSNSYLGEEDEDETTAGAATA